MNNPPLHLWEKVELTTPDGSPPAVIFRRLRVEGGWIYRHTHNEGVALCFVPDLPQKPPVARASSQIEKRPRRPRRRDLP